MVASASSKVDKMAETTEDWVKDDKLHPDTGSPSPVACSLLCVDSVRVQSGG